MQRGLIVQYLACFIIRVCVFFYNIIGAALSVALVVTSLTSMQGL